MLVNISSASVLNFYHFRIKPPDSPLETKFLHTSVDKPFRFAKGHVSLVKIKSVAVNCTRSFFSFEMIIHRNEELMRRLFMSDNNVPFIGPPMAGDQRRSVVV